MKVNCQSRQLLEQAQREGEVVVEGFEDTDQLMVRRVTLFKYRQAHPEYRNVKVKRNIKELKLILRCENEE